MDNMTQIVITIVGIFGTAGIWKYLETRLKARFENQKEIMQQDDGIQFRDNLKERVARLEDLLGKANDQVITLTAEVHALRTEVAFLHRENERLKMK